MCAQTAINTYVGCPARPPLRSVAALCQLIGVQMCQSHAQPQVHVHEPAGRAP